MSAPMSLVSLFCKVDDFCIFFENHLKDTLIGCNQRKERKRTLCMSEVMTIIIFFHQRHYRNFKHFYCDYLCKYYRKEFPNLVSYNRFVELMQEALLPLTIFLKTQCLGSCTGLSFIDSSAIAVCDNHRISSNRVFKGLAERSRTSTGWFYGFKLHLVASFTGELIAVNVTVGNVDDRKPVPKLLSRLFGMVFGDKGYVSAKLAESLAKKGIQLIAKPKKNMKKKVITAFEKAALRKRSIIETIYDQLKNISQIEHTRHRSVKNFAVNLVAGLIAYTEQEKKPSIDVTLMNQLPSSCMIS